MDMFYNFNDLVAALHEDIVEFKYFKADGTLRTARGSINKYAIAEATGKDPMKCIIKESNNSNVIRYWDIDANAVRSFNVANAITQRAPEESHLWRVIDRKYIEEFMKFED